MIKKLIKLFKKTKTKKNVVVNKKDKAEIINFVNKAKKTNKTIKTLKKILNTQFRISNNNN